MMRISHRFATPRSSPSSPRSDRPKRERGAFATTTPAGGSPGPLGYLGFGAAVLCYKGHAKVVVDRTTDTLVGATFVGNDVAELLHSATTAIVGKVPLETLWHAVPSFQTISEVWLRLLESRG